jgi:DNA primase catalytic core
MKQRLSNLDSIVSALKPFLEQYLQEHGIDTSKNFLCITTKHDDKDASMTCRQVPEQAFCFGCNATADIFMAAHYLEGKPTKGRGWLEDNLLYLAKKYNVSVELEDLTPDELYRYRTFRAYELAAELVADPKFGDYKPIKKEIKKRGWELDKVSEWGIGTVNYTKFKERMKAAGFEAGFLSGIDLDRSNLFNETNLIFTIFDEYSRPVGFSARNLNYQKGNKKNGRKYNATRTTGLECNIFKKGERLYGFDIAKETNPPLYVFEGSSDVITARHKGVMNCCCTLGTAFTDHHINLLKRTGVFSLAFVFDADTGGDEAIRKILDDKLSKERDFRIRLVQLPRGMDPDQLIREQGVDEFVRLKKWDPFEWRMMKFMETIDTEPTDEERREIAEKMIPIIVAEPSHIHQEDMAKQVAKVTGFDTATIMSEVRRLRNEKEAEVQKKKVNAIESFVSEVRYNPELAEQALVQCQQAVDDINRKFDESTRNPSSVVSFVLSQKELDENKSDKFAGFVLDPKGLGGVGRGLNDDWRKDTLMFVGGSEQSGKTTFCSQLAYEIADNIENNAIVIYHSIDDSAKFILYKLVCNAANSLGLQLNQVGNPNYWEKEGPNDFVKLREKGYRKLIEMIQNERIILKDASDGNSLAYAESLARYYRERHADRNIVLVIDNFHKLPDFPKIIGHERVKRISNQLKLLTVSNHITVICTAEYRKLAHGEMPHNTAMAESRALAYDASVILHLYNDLHNKGENEATIIHKHDGEIMPRVWCKFGKNKVSGYEGREFLDLYPRNGQFRAVDRERGVNEQRERIAFLSENQAKLAVF